MGEAVSDIFNDALQAIAANLQQLMISVEQLQESVREGGRERADTLRRIYRLEDAIIATRDDIISKYGANDTFPTGDNIIHYETRSFHQRLSLMHEQLVTMVQQIEQLQIDP
jgi:Mg2+ and Co2+ transporter CorA